MHYGATANAMAAQTLLLNFPQQRQRAGDGMENSPDHDDGDGDGEVNYKGKVLWDVTQLQDALALLCSNELIQNLHTKFQNFNTSCRTAAHQSGEKGFHASMFVCRQVTVLCENEP